MEPGPVASSRPALPRLVAVGGGKGGVGKTVLSANLATALAQNGQRVIAIDMDLEGANLHTCLGRPAPHVSLGDFVAQREEDLGKLALETTISNLRLIAGTHANLAEAQPGHLRRVRLIRALRQLDADYVVLDLGAGVHPASLDYFLVAEHALLVLTPEPTSVENAYTFLRAAFYRRLRLAMVGHDVRRLVAQAMDQRNERGIRTPLDLLREVEELDPREGARFVEAMRQMRPKLIVNEVRSAQDIKLGFAVSKVCHRYFGVEAEYLGYVNHDEAVRKSIVARKPLIEFAPTCDAAIYLQRIARKLIASQPDTTARNAVAPASRRAGTGVSASSAPSTPSTPSTSSTGSA